jgi:hypothetical protein
MGLMPAYWGASVVKSCFDLSIRPGLLMMSADESPNSRRAKDMASFTNHSLIHNQAATQTFHCTVNYGLVY